jgi:hypothetical protein
MLAAVLEAQRGLLEGDGVDDRLDLDIWNARTCVLT